MEREQEDLGAAMPTTRVAGGVGSTKRAGAEMSVGGGGIPNTKAKTKGGKAIDGGGMMGSVDIPNTKAKTKGGKAIDGGGMMGSVVPKTKLRRIEISPEALEAYQAQVERDADMALARFEAEMDARAAKASSAGGKKSSVVGLPMAMTTKGKAEDDSMEEYNSMFIDFGHFPCRAQVQMERDQDLGAITRVAGGGGMGSVVPKTKIRKLEISPEALEAYQAQVERDADMALARFEAEMDARAAKIPKASASASSGGKKSSVVGLPMAMTTMAKKKPSMKKLVKIDQRVIDMLERNPTKPVSPTYPDPTLVALVQMQIDFEKDILRQSRDNGGYVDLSM